MANREQNPFTCKPVRTRRDRNIHVLLERARRRQDPDAIRELEELGIRIIRREENR